MSKEKKPTNKKRVTIETSKGIHRIPVRPTNHVTGKVIGFTPKIKY